MAGYIAINKWFLAIPFLYSALEATRFNRLARVKINSYELLEKKGITQQDANRIAFVKNWSKVRETGKAKYCLYNGGIIGLILFIPISLIALLSTNNIEVLFAELNKMMSFTANCVVASYITGAGLYYVRWKINERKFIHLTDPLRHIWG